VGVCGSAGVIAWHGTTQVSFGPTPVTAFSLSAPNASRAGDLVVAVVWLGGSNNAVAPTLNPPVGWALIRRIDHTTVGTLAVYQHVYAVTDSSFTWTSSETLLGMMWMSSYGGVRTTSPIDAEDGWDLSLDGGTSVDTPPISAPAGDAVIVAFTGFSDPTAGLWGSLPEFSARVNANNGGARQGLGADQVLQTSITQQSYSDTSTAGLSYALTFALAIHPAP
jgi:hypothetical protein